MSDQTKVAAEEISKGVGVNAESTEKIVENTNAATAVIKETRILSSSTAVTLEKVSDGKEASIETQHSQISRVVQEMSSINDQSDKLRMLLER